MNDGQNINENMEIVLKESLEIFLDRNKVYGNAHQRHGKMMSVLFPNGIMLKTAEDFTRYTYISGVIGKLNRYCNNFNEGGHRDSSIDPINMLAMLTVFDDRQKDEENS